MQKFDIRKLNTRPGRLALLALLVTGALGIAFFAWPSKAQAHCDSVQGPVVMAAEQALETGEVNLVLPYVRAEDEAELAAAFKQAKEVRKLSPEARELAETYFYETAVRLHRQGEGAAFTGLKDEAVPESIRLADQAMLSGDLVAVEAMLGEALQAGLHEKYEAVVHARQAAEKEGTMEAHRERVEAELMFEKYVYELEGMLAGETVHAEGAAEVGGHGH